MTSNFKFTIDSSSLEYQKCLQKLEDHKKRILEQRLDELRKDPWNEAIQLKHPLSNKHKVIFDNGAFRLVTYINFEKSIIKPCYIIQRRRKAAYEQIW